MRMRTAISSLVLAAAICLAACSPTPVRGVVVKKNYRPAWTQTLMMPISTGESAVMIPQIIHHPEQWDLVVQNDGTSGEQGQFLVVISQSRWDEMSVGDVWEREDTVK